MYKKIIFLITLILLPSTIYAIDLTLDKTTYAQEDQFQGSITLDSGTYLSNEQVTLTTTSDSTSLPLQTLINCTVADCNNVVATYTTSGATETLLSGSSLLTGLKIRKNSVIEDAYFDIRNTDSNLPDDVKIDIGADNSPEWIYQGSSTSNFPPITISQTSNFEETIVTENCQQFTLQKSTKYKINAYLKKEQSASTLDVHIADNPQADGSCTSQPTTSWGLIECNLNLPSPLDPGSYFICLTGNNNILATNSSSPNPQGYIGCSSGCSSVGKNYIMNVSAADFITTLDNTENFNTSNTKKDSFGFFKPLTDILNEYLPTCPLQGNDCILPIRISSNNNQSLTISNLNYKETTEIGEILIQHNFLSYVEQQGAASQIILNSQTSIPLASFDFKTPQQINTHDLTATIKSETDTEEYTVVIGPKAKINVTSNSADILELIKFDGSDSTAPNNSELSYLWDFDDTSTSTLINPLHSYTKAGTYVVSLTVTDDNNISSTTLKAMTIGALRAQNQATLDEALSLLDEAQQYSTTATPKIKEVYAALDLNEEIKTAKATLVRLSESQADIQPQINSILSSIPKTLSVSNSFEVTPFLRTEDIDALLPLQQESFKDTARTVNEKISQKIKTYLVSTTYLSGQREDFILVRKTINVPQSIPNAVVVDLLPTTILPTQSSISFVKPSTAQVTKFDSSQSVRFSLSNLDVATTNEIVYKLSTTNIGEISKLKTIVLPEDLNVALVPINCGDNICNPGEDILICPEDCTCGNNICEIDETESSCPADCGSKSLVFYVSLLVILGVIVAAGVVVYKNPKLRQQLKINELISKIKSRKKPFSSPSELDKVVDFIKSSKKEGHVDKQISLTLTKKGWTKKQVKHALKKAKKE